MLESQFIARIALVVASVALHASTAFCKPQTLVIAGGASRDRSYPVFKKNSKNAFESATMMGHNAEVFAEDGSWGFKPEGKVHAALSVGDLEDLIEKMAKNLKPGEVFNFFIDDHGSEPKSDRSPETSGFYLFSKSSGASAQKVTNEELLSMIKKYVPASSPVHIVGTQCFSGGVHTISFDRPNTCSVANSDFRTTAKSDPERDPYSEGFHDYFFQKIGESSEEGKRTSLFDAHMRGFSKDTVNQGRGDASSFAYVDSVLKEDSYTQKDSWWQRVSGSPSQVSPPKNDYLVCAVEGNFATEIKRLGEISAILGQGPQNIYQKAIDDWNANHGQYEAVIQRAKADIAKIQRDWNALDENQKQLQRWKLTEDYEKVTKRFQQESGKFMSTYYLLYKLQKVSKFMKSANAEQKTKFAELIKCENGPFF